MRAALLSAIVVMQGGFAWAGVSLQATVQAAAGVTDNVASVQTQPIPGTVGRESDFLLLISPGLVLAGGTPRAVQQLSYTFGGVIYGKHSEADTYTNTLAWQGLFLPSKRTRMGLSFGLTQGRTSAFNTAIGSANQPAQTQLSGLQNILTVSAGETLAWELSQSWHLYQTLGYATTYYLDPHPPQGAAQAVPASLTLERTFTHQSVALEVDATLTDFFAQRGPVTLPNGSVDGNGVVQPEQYQIILTPTLQYRRDFTYWLSGRANLGATYVVDPTDSSNHYVSPAGGAGLNFNATRVNVDLSYQRTVSPNLLFRSNFLTDTASLHGTFLLSRVDHVTLALTLSYLYGRALDLHAQPEGHAQTILGDATLAWAPLKQASFFVRYQLIDQIGQAGSAAAAFPLPSYYRNTLLFGINAVYPAESAVQVPVNNVGLRADHSDDARIEVSKSTVQ